MVDSSQLKIKKYVKHGTEVPASESLGSRYARDVTVWNKLENLINTNNHSHKHVLELFPAYVRRIHLGRFLAHYELFKLINDIPGCIVEALQCFPLKRPQSHPDCGFQRKLTGMESGHTYPDLPL